MDNVVKILHYTTSSRVSFSRARFFLCPLLPSACYAGYLVYGKDKGPCFASVTHTVLITPTLRSCYPLVFISAPFYWFFPLQKL